MAPPDKTKLLEQAQKALAKGKTDAAIRAFQELVELDPRAIQYRLRFAELLAKAGKMKEAIDNFEKVAAVYTRDDQVVKAIAVYKTVVRLDPERLEPYEKLAELYRSQGLEGEASSQLQQVYEGYQRQKNEEGQVRVLRRMVEVDPENLGIQVRLGETLARLGRKQEAGEAFAKAATTLSRRGFHDRASTLFQKIIALNPKNLTVRKELCSHHLEAGEFQLARKEVEAILEMEPDDPRMVLLLGRILFRLGEEKQAMRAVGRSLDIFTANGELEKVLREFLFVAQSHLRQGDLPEAGAFYSEIRRVAPQELGALKGMVAVADARRDRPAQVALLLELGKALVERGDRKGASDAFHKVLEYEPLNQEAHQLIAGGGEPGPSAGPGFGEGEDRGRFAPGEGFIPIEEMEGEVPGGEAIPSPEEPVEIVEEEAEPAPGTVAEETIEGMGDFESLLPQAGGPEEEPVLELDLLEVGGGEPGEPGEPGEIVVSEEEVSEVSEGMLEIAPEEGLIVASEPPPSTTVTSKAPVGEQLVEAELYARYGLADKALEILRGLRSRDPGNLQVLEAFFGILCDTRSPEAGAIASELVSRLRSAGEGGRAAEAVRRLGEAVPGAPELAALTVAPVPARPAPPLPPPAPQAAPVPPAAPPVEIPGPARGDRFAEDLEEAEFYLSQGLEEEALRIYQNILTRSPGHPVATAQLAAMGQEAPPAPVAPPPPPAPEPAFAPLPRVPAAVTPEGPHHLRSKLIVEDEAPESLDFLDLASELRQEMAEELEAEEKKPVPKEEGPVTFEEVFAEFKKGIAETLGDQEYETHYNLGIAYKDMGLFEDAIREFQTASRDPKLFSDSLGLMSICFLEKGDSPSALQSIATALVSAPPEQVPGLYYQQGKIQEAVEDYAGALASYNEVEGLDPTLEGLAESIRRVTERLSQGRQQPEAEEEPHEDSFDALFSELIKQMGDMPEEGPAPAPAPGRKGRVDYL